MNTVKRAEYPRPQFVRENWQNLNGEWDFVFDDLGKGVADRYFDTASVYDQKIRVPFVYQSQESGIGDCAAHDIVWYHQVFSADWSAGQRVLLHFGAVDYEADVYVNGQHVLNHIGGHVSFTADITYSLTVDSTGAPAQAEQRLSVRVYDPQTDESIPRGKQSWEGRSSGIWYTNTTGIWQTVWLEVVNAVYITDLTMTPIFDEGKISFAVNVNDLRAPLSLRYAISFKGAPVASGAVDINSLKTVFDCELFHEHIFCENYHNDGWSWTPENPNLFDVVLTLVSADDEKHEGSSRHVWDEVSSYFGMRKVHQADGRIYLNNKPYYQKLVLDQGYWPTGLLTAPTDHDFKTDIEIAKSMGFNGCRKHQKVADPRFLYWADKLGYLVWGECAAPAIYNRDSTTRLMREWKEIIERDYNHPSIVTWVPINESWGVPQIAFDRQQEHFSQAMYHYIYSLDTTRLVVSNDGWAQTDTDICSIHNYNHGTKDEVQKYEYFKETLSTRHNLINWPGSPWPIFAKGFSYGGQPILLTEFGGIGYNVRDEGGWGYTSVTSPAEFVDEYRRIMDAVYASHGLWGFCYTQLTDVEQETNGLCTFDREPKCDIDAIRAINDGFHVLNVE